MTETQSPMPAPPPNSWVRPLVDFGALIAFVGAFIYARVQGMESNDSMVLATWALTIASAIALSVGFIVERRLAPLPLITGSFALIFGILTIVLHDGDVIKIKITVLNGLLALVLLGGVMMGKSPAKMLLGDSIRLPDAAWRTLTIRYGLYFAACAIANEIVWRTQSDDVWITVFRPALWVAAIAFGLAQLPFIMKHLIRDEPETPQERTP